MGLIVVVVWPNTHTNLEYIKFELWLKDILNNYSVAKY